LTIDKTNIDKVSRLLEILDKHINEKNCRHTPRELYMEYTGLKEE